MDNRKTWLSHRSEPDTVSEAVGIVRSLERLELPRCGTRCGAQRSIASKLHIGSATIDNLLRGRIKRIDAGLRDRLQALLINELQLEISRLSHELAIAMQGGAAAHSDEITSVEKLLSEARAVLNGIVGKGKLNANSRRMQNGG